MRFNFKGGGFELPGRPLLMGVVNVTPDSFSDGDECTTVAAALDRARRMVAGGADLLDVGGESTRPGAAEVAVEEEIRRVVPVVEALCGELRAPVSIDTRKSEVAERSLAAGAAIVNDVSGLQHDTRMAKVVAAAGCGLVGMHMRGTPATMQGRTDYRDVVAEVRAFLRQMVAQAVAAGVPEENIAVDPGIGFGKTAGQNMEIIRRLGEFAMLGRPLLMGVSRKSFIGKALDIGNPKERMWGTAAAVAICVFRGAHIVRVHDVAEMRQVADMAAAIRD
jgi:dihydropteroate synthase